jgi:hypothetical protein
MRTTFCHNTGKKQSSTGKPLEQGQLYISKCSHAQHLPQPSASAHTKLCHTVLPAESVLPMGHAQACMYNVTAVAAAHLPCTQSLAATSEAVMPSSAADGSDTSSGTL